MFEGTDISTLFAIFCSIALLYAIGRVGFFRFLFNLLKGAFYILTVSVIVYLIMNYPNEVYNHANRFLAEMKEIVVSILV
ncbi:MAG: hypothetical protein ABIJ45_13285 [Candidatus Zixiibacteriota bacterium]